LPAFHGVAPKGADEASAGTSRAGAGAAPASTPVGESWLLGDDNVVTNGPYAGSTVAELATRFGAALLGTANTARYGDKLALLAKFLDAAADLSVQAHPDDAYALSRERGSGHLGKAEAWYVLTSAPGATVSWGFRRDVTAAEVRAAVTDGSLPSLLNRLPVAAGDVIVNPAGLVHAVGAGVKLFEIQQSSDLTYRLFDYDRRDATGRPRELHVDKALDVARLGRSAAADMFGRVASGPVVANRWRRLVQLPEFVMDAVELGEAGAPARLRDATTPASLELLVLSRGEVTVSAGEAVRTGEAVGAVEAVGAGEAASAGKAVTMRQGDAVLLPALAGAYVLEGAGEVLRCAVEKPLPG